MSTTAGVTRLQSDVFDVKLNVVNVERRKVERRRKSGRFLTVALERGHQDNLLTGSGGLASGLWPLASGLWPEFCQTF